MLPSAPHGAATVPRAAHGSWGSCTGASTQPHAVGEGGARLRVSKCSKLLTRITPHFCMVMVEHSLAFALVSPSPSILSSLEFQKGPPP